MTYRDLRQSLLRPPARVCPEGVRSVRTPARAHGARVHQLLHSLWSRSWLHNLEAYRRLFPKSYLASAHAIHGRFQHMPLWGQFVDRHGEIKERLTRLFQERIERESRLDRLEQCFPFQVLSVRAPVAEFY